MSNKLLLGSFALLAACAPLVYPINYSAIRGTVGYELHARTRALCADPQVITPARIEQGDLPPGVELGAEGNLYGTPSEAGKWHAMIRLARTQCGQSINADDRVCWNFDISPAPVAAR